MKKLIILLVLFSQPLQVAWSDVVPPNIQNTNLEPTVELNEATGVYEYRYLLENGSGNTEELTTLMVDISTVAPHMSPLDPDLYNDQSRDDSAVRSYGPYMIPARTVTVGLQSPFAWGTGVGITGEIVWGSNSHDVRILPTQASSNFVAQAKAPPGPRKYIIVYRSDLPVPDIPYSAQEQTTDSPSPLDYRFHGVTAGPVPANELKLYDDKGLPADPNAFLSYAYPDQFPLIMPEGRTWLDIIVYYGEKIQPESFTAVLLNTNTVTQLANETVLTSRFSPSPGGYDVVRINLRQGTNTLVLGVNGDQDTLGVLEQGIDVDNLQFIVP